MKQKWIGHAFEVSAVGFGCMGLSHAFGTAVDAKDASKLVRTAYDIGYTMFDTAECYHGQYADGSLALNEDVVGEGLKGIRHQVILATKCGVRHMGDHLEMDSRPETIRASLEGSLKRLQTDYIDLYYQHRVDPNVTPEEVAGVMGELMKEGKIRAWGLSAVGEEYLRRAHAVTPVSAVENCYSMIDRATESLFPVLEELGVSMVCYTPLAKGFLSGSYLERPTFDKTLDNRGGRYQFSEKGFAEYQSVLAVIREMAEQKHATMAQIALAWEIDKKPYLIPIPGTRNPARMKENLEAAQLDLTPAEIAALDAALDRLHVVDAATARVSFR